MDVRAVQAAAPRRTAAADLPLGRTASSPLKPGGDLGLSRRSEPESNLAPSGTDKSFHHFVQSLSTADEEEKADRSPFTPSIAEITVCVCFSSRWLPPA